ncbi:lycopene cyclase family protein [Goekera deserti]|uniref:FAD-binding protein n=1 Tax=Goekera deserti TaxID=2497753 RepID=A0A7K3WCU3_9ACTN|nr:lycopene cyclase family protein [Goekera deserti]NDI46719.1 FAD-binding protein [Goekera deserti]NEL54288.1 FAD-binding protein [Goekera deserti]
MQRTADVVVAGAGPAGLAAAAACARAGRDTVVVAPSLERWPHTYGLWADEFAAVAPALGLDAGAAATVYPATVVRTRAGGEQRLPRAYARLRNEVVHAALLEQVPRRVRGRVTGLTDTAVTLADGSRVEAGVVLDARGSGPGRAQQRAWGEVVEAPVPDLVPAGGALFMDLAVLAEAGAPPAFLYGFDLGDGSTLLEATSLAARPPVPLPDLRRRLHRLLDHRGLRPVGPPEKVAIALDAAARRGPGVPIGAAAGLVHPATGYSVASSLRLAPRLAAALGHGADAPALRRVVAAARPPGTARLLALGREVLLLRDADALDAFFAGFFTLPPETWAAYLDVGSPARDVARVMWRTYRALPGEQRRRLLADSARLAARRC